MEHRRLEDVVLGAPSQDRARQTDPLTRALKKLVLEVLLAAFLKKRMATLVTTEKRLQVLKVTHTYFSFFSCFYFWMIFLCFGLSASVKWAFFQRLRGKENETDHENSKSDSADTST